MRSSLVSTGDWDEPLSLTPTNSQYIRPLSTLDFLGFLGHNANKFMAAFEWILTLDKKSQISYEHCKAMTMFLQALPFAFDSGPITRHRQLWKEQFQHRKKGPSVLGIGMESTLINAGYMWLLPRIDWEKMVFRPRIAQEMAFTSSMLRDHYWKHGTRVRDAKDDYTRVEAAGQWLNYYGTSQDCKDMIFGFLILLAIRAYRKEVYAYLKPHFINGFYEEAITGEIPLCDSELERILTTESLENMCIVDGKRTKIRSVEALVLLIWGVDDGIERGHWENMAFRALFKRASQLIEQYCGADDQFMFQDTVKRYFIATNWLVPYPRNTKFFQKNQRKETMWMAVYHLRLAYSGTKYNTKLPLSFLLNTVKSRPTRYRPRRVPWLLSDRVTSKEIDAYAPASVQYMPDWAISAGDTDAVMSQVPLEPKEDYLRPDASLEAVGQVLENTWQLGQQIDEAE